MIQFTTLRSMSSLHSLSIKILWSIKSNALQYSNNIVLTVAPFPSIPRNHAWSMLIRAMVDDDFGIAPYWFP